MTPHLHVIGLPHTNVTRSFSACAFTEKVRKFCVMMKRAGYPVTLYAAGTDNEAPCDEFVSCLAEKSRPRDNYTLASWDNTLPHWQQFNSAAITAIGERIGQKDVICIIGGLSHKPIADAFPNHMTVEFGIGYKGAFAKYRVFESYAWMHHIYGREQREEGAWYDAVIPGYMEAETFPAARDPDDYYFFIGRLGTGKGEQIAADVTARLGKRLITAGPGTPPAGDHVQHVGMVSADVRNCYMVSAVALFAPTVYIEPFGNIVPEAQMCGTPTITTDWGAFTETNTHGMTGYRCRHQDEFIDAAIAVRGLDRRAIQDHARSRYSLEVIGPQYDEYFKRLSTLWGNGWYSSAP